MSRALLVAAALALTLTGCVTKSQLTKVEAAAGSFHAHQAAREDAANYAAADDAFHGRIAEAAFVKTQGAIRALTECSAPTRDPNYVKPGSWSGGTYVYVRYIRTCREGAVTEWMAFTVTIDGPARLDDYDPSGPGL